MELLMLIDAARRASARRITAVMPYYGYARQDRKDRPRVPISIRQAIKSLQKAGGPRLRGFLTMDIHNEASMGIADRPWDNVYASWSFIPVLQALSLADLVVASPDIKGGIRAQAYAKRLGTTRLAVVYKFRDPDNPNQSEATELIGDVERKTVVIVDDILDTGGTLCNGAALIKERGADRIYAAITHGLFSGPALKRIAESPIEKIFITDSVPATKAVLANPRIEIVTVAPLLAGVIKCIYTGDSISERFILA